MRKAQKQELLDCIKSLQQAHEEIKGALQQNNLATVQTMLTECQEFAVSIGTAIEKLESAGHVSISYVEEYCELLFHVYEQLSTPPISQNSIYKVIKKQLIKIENSVKNDIREKKEIVFLPYKAAMWDSLESVWLAAKEDKNCDAYVVAIPYYERNRDQSFGLMHYEGNEYPKEVPIIDWQKYRFEERKPDIVYIQNPYDDWNLVTCVHPRFFSREIKKYTNMLVYIPYFVGTNDHVDDYFCTTPGVINADKVIVQSEKVKKIYMETIRQFEQEQHCKGLFGNLEQKILPLGSPKLDRVQRISQSANVDLPMEWKLKIYQTDGVKKKVILYNTTINALLKYSVSYMNKLRRVLEIFKQEKKFVLLWRPHPLLESTIKSMRPELYRDYMSIKETYIREDWGIYDETADIERAIVISDAYYGDNSSVVELYRATGKPIMIQKCED